MATPKIARELSIFINDREVVNSLGGITREITKVNGEIRNLNKNSATYTDDLKKLQSQLGSLKNSQQEFKDEIADTTLEMGAAREAAGKIFSGLLSGDMAMAKDGFVGIKGAIATTTSAALAFIATPIGATIAVLAGIAVAAKQWVDYNETIKESTRLIENLSGKTGQAVADIRNYITGLSETYNVEFKSIAAAVDNLVDTGAVKDELEGLQLIKNGLLTAPDANEFIASLESSALSAKQVGLDLQQIISLKQQIEETGIDPEKVFGALQKASLNLSKQTDVLKQDLRDALGAAFADDILAKVKSGEITVVQALQAIGKKSEEVGLNQKQQAELTVQIFGKAGTAAGGLISITESLTAAQENQTQALTPLQEATQQLADSNIALAEAQDRALRSEGYEQFKTNAVSFLNSVKQGFFDLIFEMTNYESIRDRIAEDSEKKGIGNYTSDAIKSFEDYVDLRQKRMGELFDFETVREERLATIREQLSKYSGWDSTEAEQAMAKRLEAELDAVRKYSGARKEISEKATADEIREQNTAADKLSKERARANEKKKSEEERARKEHEEALIAVANARANLAKVELESFISNNRSRIDAEKELTPEIIAEETKRLDEIKFRRQNALAEQRLNDIAEAELKAKSAEELHLLKQAIDTEYLTAEQNLALEFYKTTDELKKQYDEEQKVLKAEQLLADNELALLEASTKAEAEKLQQEQDYQEELARYKKLHADKKITDEEYLRFKEAAKNKQDELDRVRELQQTQSVLGGLSSVAGAIGEMFGQSKELALIQAGINGAMAVTSILAQYPKFDGGFAMWAAIATAGITTVAQIGKIAKAKAPKAPKFYDGGYTGNFPALGYDEHGPITGVVHKKEWVAPEYMTQSPRYAATISWLEAERKYNLRKFAGGGESSPGTLPVAIPDSMQGTEGLSQTLSELNQTLRNGIWAKVLFGYQEAEEIDQLNQETRQSKQNGIVS